MASRQWFVTGWDGTEKIYEDVFRLSDFSEEQMKSLLQRLVCKHLTYDEIASLSRKRKPNEGHGELEVLLDASSNRFTMSVGSNPYFTAQSKET